MVINGSLIVRCFGEAKFHIPNQPKNSEVNFTDEVIPPVPPTCELVIPDSIVVSTQIEHHQWYLVLNWKVNRPRKIDWSIDV